MNRVVGQLRTWWLLEAVVRLTWGLARWVAVGLTILGLACLADWVYDRYDDTPWWARVANLVFQCTLAVGTAFLFVLRPLRRSPSFDDLATRAERAIPEFGHRLVTALQLNRPGAQTRGMSPVLIAEVTREAGEMASRHQLIRLANFRPLLWAFLVAFPVLAVAGGVIALNPTLAFILLKRQALLDVDIPRSVQLESVTRPLWPNGAEAVIEIRVTGEWERYMVGVTLVRPDGQPEDRYDLKFDRQNSDGSAVFVAKLPPSSSNFDYRARLSDGRTRKPGRVEFVPAPQARDIEAWQLLPTYLGKNPQGGSFERQSDGGVRGEVIDALPLSGIRVKAHFSKPVKTAILKPIERSGGNSEEDGPPAEQIEFAADRLSAEWVFGTTPKTIGYRIDITDDHDFPNPHPIRRGVKMWVDQPPDVERLRESTRHPDPNDYYGQGDPELYQCDMPLTEVGKIMVVYHARSPLGIGEVYLAYRVIPKGQEPDSAHPKDDPFRQVFRRHGPLRRPDLPPSAALGRFVPDLGVFEQSFAGLESWPQREQVMIPFYPFPSRDLANEPADLEAGGRTYLTLRNPNNPQLSGLLKPNGDPIIMSVGDTIEVYVEVFDKYESHLVSQQKPGVQRNPRAAGYPREAIRKTVVEPDEAWLRTHQRKVTQSRLKDKLDAIRIEQEDLFGVPTPKK